MDSMLSTAARALGAADPLAALKLEALREDPPALALRGIAMAQLGDFARAQKLLLRAERTFGKDEALARARCVTARAEVALACRDLTGVGPELTQAAETLAASGDTHNALFARLITVRRWVLLGEVAEAERAHARLALDHAPPRLVAVAELLAADIAVRRLSTRAARAALARARAAAAEARLPPLAAEVARAQLELDAPAARLVVSGAERELRLSEVEALLGSKQLIIDACRRQLQLGKTQVSLVTRPVLFALAQTLAARAPAEASREALIEAAFCVRRVNESHRARLRVEIGRLRKAVSALAELRATPGGFALAPRGNARAVLLLPAAPGEASALTALLSGGQSWSTSALAAALGKSQRALQRALGALLEAGKVQSMGRGRAQRWVAPPNTGFATTLLLVARGPLS
jgi:DNA-binding transcriptional ArsR family regulator